MKKTSIYSAPNESLGMHQVVVTMNTNELTIETKEYYNGKIYRKETVYCENEYTHNFSWENTLEYYREKEYTIITL